MNFHFPDAEPNNKLRKKLYDRNRQRDLKEKKRKALEDAGAVIIQGHRIQKPVKQPVFKDHPLARPLHIAFDELTSLTCRWPYGEAGPFTFCGCETQEGRAYCKPHCELGTQKGGSDAELG